MGVAEGVGSSGLVCGRSPGGLLFAGTTGGSVPQEEPLSIIKQITQRQLP